MRTIKIFIILVITVFNCNALFATERTELVGKRTYFSKTYANEDGSLTSEISLNYIHYKQGNDFIEIDRDFKPVDTLGYNYAVKQGLYDVYFKNDLSENFPVTFESKDKYRLRTKTIKVGYLNKESKQYQNLQNIKSSLGQVTDNAIYYQNAFNNVDIKYTYLETQLKEEIFITQQARNQLPDPGVFGFDLNDTYLVFVTRLDFDELETKMYVENNDSTFTVYEGENRIDFKDYKNEIKYFFPLDVAYHAQEKDSIPREHEVKVRKRLYKYDNQWYLLAGVPLNWISSLEQGTIIIDPSITININTDKTCQDAFVYKWLGDLETANNNYGTHPSLLAYAWTKNGIRNYYRSFFKFDFSVIPSGAKIESASITLDHDAYPHGSGTLSRCTNANTYLWRVTQPWRELDITWNNQPATTTVNQVSVAAPSGLYDPLNADVTNLVKDILNSEEGNNGFLLRLQVETYYRGVRYASKDLTDQDLHLPKLTITYTEVQKAYYLKDHLGNIRVTINQDGDVISADDYYPFGKRLGGRSFNLALTGNLYKFSSKELDEENDLNWYYFGARYYDAEIGRFLSVDRFAEKYPSSSPYHYVLNNPLRFTDMTGDTVDIDPDLLTPIVYTEGDKKGEQKSAEDMTWEELQKYGFQLWWNDNGADILKLFGIGGKYEATNIRIKFDTKPLGFFESLTERNQYWGTTTWAQRGTREVDFNRGRTAIQPDFEIDQLDSYIYINPEPGAKPNGTHAGHEWYHFKIIFDAVKNGTKVPNAINQHRLIDHLNIPMIK